MIEGVETPFARLLSMSLLLGLDVNLVYEKYRLKRKKDKVESYLANLEKDQIFRNFFTKDKDVTSELLDLDDKIAKLESDLANFQVAEDYHVIESKADDARRRLQSISNRSVVIENAIEHIEASLHIKPDLSSERVQKLYAEARVVFSEALKRSVEEVMDFHKKLIENRIKRLQEEQAKLRDQLRKIRGEKKAVGDELDGHLKYLGAHSALDVFLSLSKALADYRSEASKLREYKKLLETYRSETQSLKAALAQETIRAEQYLQANSSRLAANAGLFRSFAKRFYPESPSSLSVINNDGDNQNRFDISAKIQSDASDGINEVKIFCFDFTILKIAAANNIRFLFHDSRLFSDVDARQAATLFRIAASDTLNKGLQYIATINEDQVNAMKQHYSAEEFEAIIASRITLTLTDEDASAKLLGIQVDIE
jgi:uncharacterized protein YydD (DUF2326 family)